MGQIQWDVNFYRFLNDWELGMLADFFLIHQTKITRDVMPTKGKPFEVKSYYKVLNVGAVTLFSWVLIVY